MVVEVEVNSMGLESWLKGAATKMGNATRLFQIEGGFLVTEEMRSQVPVRTGFLRESIATVYSPDGFMVYPTATYARYVDQGTKPHPIFPLAARVLRFQAYGKTVFARHVMHSGFQGRFFIARTMDAVREKLVDLVREILEALRD